MVPDPAGGITSNQDQSCFVCSGSVHSISSLPGLPANTWLFLQQQEVKEDEGKREELWRARACPRPRPAFGGAAARSRAGSALGAGEDGDDDFL